MFGPGVTAAGDVGQIFDGAGEVGGRPYFSVDALFLRLHHSSSSLSKRYFSSEDLILFIHLYNIIVSLR
jgi:hypothetical protein